MPIHRGPGMGTTLTAAIVDAVGEEVAIGHVGDSRAYRLRGARFERLTRDHSLVEEMRRKGQLTEAQAEDHPQRSIITRALGPESEVEPDLQTVAAAAGDVFLICSDGLTTMLGEEQIAKLLAGASSMSAAVRALVDEANRAGGRDNITALAFRLEDAAAPQQSHEDATLIGSTAAEAGLTTTEVRRRAAAAAARDRREQLTAKPPPPRSATGTQGARGPGCCWPLSPSAPGTGTARSGSWAPMTAAGSPSTAACPTNFPSASSSTKSATPARSRRLRCRRAAKTR